MIISIVGIVETKPLVLMLSRGLSVESKMLIITNDIAYRRIGLNIDGNEMLRRIDNVDVAIKMDAEEVLRESRDVYEMVKDINDETYERYERIIVSLSDTFINGADCKIYCEGTDEKWRTSMVNSVISNYENLKLEANNEGDVDEREKVIEIVMSSTAKQLKDKTKCLVDIDSNVYVQLANIEEKHCMEIFTNKDLMNCICKVIAPALGIKSSKMNKMIKRKRVMVQNKDIGE